LLNFIVKKLPKSEVIERALRKQVTIYPEIALREILAYALIHSSGFYRFGSWTINRNL